MSARLGYSIKLVQFLTAVRQNGILKITSLSYWYVKSVREVPKTTIKVEADSCLVEEWNIGEISSKNIFFPPQTYS